MNITFLECIFNMISPNHVVEIILQIIIILTDHDKNNYSYVFVPSADFGHFPQIKQTAKLQCSEKIMYSHFRIRHVAR